MAMSQKMHGASRKYRYVWAVLAGREARRENDPVRPWRTAGGADSMGRRRGSDEMLTPELVVVVWKRGVAGGRQFRRRRLLPWGGARPDSRRTVAVSSRSLVGVKQPGSAVLLDKVG